MSFVVSVKYVSCHNIYTKQTTNMVVCYLLDVAYTNPLKAPLQSHLEHICQGKPPFSVVIRCGFIREENSYYQNTTKKLLTTMWIILNDMDSAALLKKNVLFLVSFEQHKQSTVYYIQERTDISTVDILQNSATRFRENKIDG